MDRRWGTDRVTSIVKSVSDPIFVLDDLGTVTTWNEAAVDVFGYAIPEAVGESVFELLSLHGVNRHRVESMLERSEVDSSVGSPESVSITATRAEGTAVRVELDRIDTNPAILLADPIDQSSPARTTSGFFDVSVHRLAIEHSTDLIAAIDRNERLLIANERYRHFHQLGDQVTGKPLEEALAPETYAEIHHHLGRVFEGETAQFEMERTGPDGTDHILDVRYYPLETQKGQIRGVVSTMREITGLKRQSQSLRNAWETYSELIEGIPHPLLLHDTDGAIIEVNDAACRVFGWNERDMVSMNLRDLLVTDGATRPYTRLEQGDSDEEFFETECETASGETIPLDVAATHVDYFGMEAVLTVMRDISAQKAYEEELERTNAGLEEFAAVVSQDLRNPLTVATGWTDIARENDATEPLERVSESLERMNHVIDYTLTLSRKGEGLDQLTRIDLGALVESSWRAVDSEDTSLQNDVDLSIRGDRGRVSYLFETLFENCTSLDGPTGSIRVGELHSKRGFFIEHEGASLPAGIDEVGSAHIGNDAAPGCDLVVIQRIANAHGWRMKHFTEAPTGLRIEFSGVDVPEQE